MLLDGVTETEIVLAWGHKFGSQVQGLENLQSTRTVDAELQQEQELHFPFGEQIPLETEEAPTTVTDILSEITNFSDKVGNDPLLLSHVLIRCKEVIQDVLNMRAKKQTGTWVQDDVAAKTPHPLEVCSDSTDANTLARKKSWFEKMMESYQKKGRPTVADNSGEDGATPLERAVKIPFTPFNQQFDAEALTQVLGVTNDVASRGKRRKRTIVTKPKIGSAKGSSKRLRKQNKENIDLNFPVLE
ncbi:hypothetical protein R1sor_012151 [Riccia sorocarpa]|uniref:Uncharacterized protein n=1 Tax=Riccia sorocarpa TaxID=122646 RepID=A0ABD3I6T3_9MARC